MKEASLAVIFSKDRSRILTIFRKDHPVWVLPGGGVEAGENPAETIVREVFEETGLHIIVDRKVALYTPVNRLGGLTHLFECRPAGGRLTTGPETAELGFFPIDALPRPFFALHKLWVEDALKNLPETIERPLRETSYPRAFCYLLLHPWLSTSYLIKRSRRSDRS